MHDLEDEDLAGDAELEDGSALPLLWWKILLAPWLRCGVFTVQPGALDRSGIEVLLLHEPDLPLHPR